jgi:superfamily I DNA and RNA helicase
MVRFNQVEGPTPIFKKYRSLDKQVAAVTEQIVWWIREDNVKPGDICILCNDNHFKEQIRESLTPRLHEIQANIISEPGTGWSRDDRSVVASTSHSFKGYDSEIVVVAGLERFIGQGQILANNLYVAMTRARSILAVYAYAHQNPNAQTKQLLTTFQDCLDELVLRPKVEQEISNLEEFEDVLERLGAESRDWLVKIWKSHRIQQEPIKANDGEILAEPLFWFQDDGRLVACFGKDSPGVYIPGWPSIRTQT